MDGKGEVFARACQVPGNTMKFFSGNPFSLPHPPLALNVLSPFPFLFLVPTMPAT